MSIPDRSSLHKSDTGPFAIVPEWLLDYPGITSGAIHLYAVLGRYADREGVAWPSHRTLADRMRCSQASVKRHIKKLQDVGALLVEQRVGEHGGPTSCRYTVLRAIPNAHVVTPPLVTSEPRGGVTGELQNENQYEREPLTGEDESPRASRSGEMTIGSGGWGDFLTRLSSSQSEGILSPVQDPAAYTQTCTRNRSVPPDHVSVEFLIDVARAVRRGLQLQAVRLPAIEDLEETERWYSRYRQKYPNAWLECIERKCREKRNEGYVPNDPKTLLLDLTQAGFL